MSPLIRLVSWLPWLAERDSVDNAVARAALLRPDVKIVIQKGDTKGAVLGIRRRSPPRLTQDAVMIESSGEQRFVPGSAVRDHLGPEARESVRAFAVVCVYTQKRLPQIRTDSMVRLVALSLGTLSVTAEYIKEMVLQNVRGLGEIMDTVSYRSQRPCITI